MKKLLSIAVVAVTVICTVKWAALESLLPLWKMVQMQTNDREFAARVVQADAAIVMDERTGDILFYKNDQKKLYPASTTKIATALVAMEHGDLDEWITVGEEADPLPGESRAGLNIGERYQLRDLIYAMMLPSGNDAARTIAVHLGRKLSGNADLSVQEATAYYVGLMNNRAKEAGARQTHFVNPHGLHDELHYTTARDLLKIAREAMRDDWFRSLVNTQTHSALFASNGPTPLDRANYTNRNQLLNRDSSYYYEPANGIKTGFTNEAGYCLVSSASLHNQDLLAVVLKSDKDAVWLDSRRVLEYGFRQLGG
ncbi:D-alanyl-D-alanine carboxypeptidase family protein [Paenibacillus senegalensis]|uniref:D-alanyl-D-alanine carboxypeptidase family protein n=1 Tax=Paenibacillus senegalensis TaxID=1465766 RepID=UPI000289982C|nr:D-alanyl-D-alanine carboxypeptidase family protein [Paenibacillus senegalensis]